MTNLTKPYCASPYVRAYVLPDGTFRDCCATHPSVVSHPQQSFRQWWFEDTRLNSLRQELNTPAFPAVCTSCQVQDASNNSLRQAINRNNPSILSGSYPCEWSIMFGNVCNLACWTCDEMFSSTVAAHKKRIGILPENYQDSNSLFMQRWPDLQKQILQSYREHDRVTLVLLGGEPSYNPMVKNFLQMLHDQGLAPQTRLELTTNGTKTNQEFFDLVTSPNWLSVSVFVSVDAIGAKAEWLRYGSRWADVEKNILAYQRAAYRVELHTVVSVLNIGDLPDLYDFAKLHNLLFTPFPLRTPEHMSLVHWDGTDLVQNFEAYSNRGLGQYAELVGTKVKAGSRKRLGQYIQQLETVRTKLSDVDPELYNVIFGG